MQTTSLKAFSYNIHKGFDAGNASFVLEKVRSAIREIDPDIVFLQEIIGENEKHRRRIPEWPSDSQMEFLAESIWPHRAYGKNAIYTHGHHGNAILSKFPISGWTNIDISQNRLESRGILHGIVEHPGISLPLHLFCLHLNVFEHGRRPQLRALCERVASEVPDGSPLIIGGDFNDWRGRASALLRSKAGIQEAFISLQGSHARSFPAKFPMLRLDRIYFRGFQIQRAEALVGSPWESLSDHIPLVCEFSI